MNADEKAEFDGLAVAGWVESNLRRIHAIEMFGDCVEDGQKFPCRTIQVLNVARSHVEETSSESIRVQTNSGQEVTAND